MPPSWLRFWAGPGGAAGFRLHSNYPGQSLWEYEGSGSRPWDSRETPLGRPSSLRSCGAWPGKNSPFGVRRCRPDRSDRRAGGGRSVDQPDHHDPTSRRTRARLCGRRRWWSGCESGRESSRRWCGYGHRPPASPAGPGLASGGPGRRLS